MHKYEIIIYWSNEDGVFVAEAPELPGVMPSHTKCGRFRQVVLRDQLGGERLRPKYEISLYWSNEDGVIEAEAPELRMRGPRRHAGGGAGAHQPSHGPVAGNCAGVRRPDPRTKG